MSIVAPDNSRGPILDLAPPTLTAGFKVLVRNKTTGEALGIDLPAAWGGKAISLDWRRRTVLDEDGADCSSLLNSAENSLWLNRQPLKPGVNVVEVGIPNLAYAALGATGDFQVVGSRAERSTTGDAGTLAKGVLGGRAVGVPLSADIITAAVDFNFALAKPKSVVGILLNVTSETDFVIATYTPSTNSLKLYSVIAGVASLLKEKASGEEESLGGTLTVQRTASALKATGPVGSTEVALGAPAAGGAYLYDYFNGAGPSTRSYDNLRFDAPLAAKATLRWEKGYY